MLTIKNVAARVAVVLSLAVTVTGVEPTTAAIADTADGTASCGRLNPGEALGRGQSLPSCNGAVTLWHQTDGNVVAYDSQGWLWQSQTAGRATTYLVMQTDGNLVLYGPGENAVWTTDTWRNNTGAFLAVQDDCNLVIYNPTIAPLVRWASNKLCRTSPPPTPPSTTVDILEYMLNPPGAPTMQDTRAGYGDMQRTIHDPVGRAFRYMKNPYDGSRWEEYRYNSDRIWLVRDTTLPAGQGHGTAYDVDPASSGGMWMPRSWSQGQQTAFNVTIRFFDHQRSLCPYSADATPWRDGRHFLRYVGRLDLGGDLRTQDVVVVDRYHDLSNPWNPRTAERFWFAKGHGWVRWESWPDSKRVSDADPTPRSDDGKLDRGEDPRFASSNPTDLFNTQPERRVEMNRFKTTSDPGFVGVTCR